MEVGRELKELRLKAKLTQENAEDFLFVDQSIISKVENGRIDITAREYFRWKEVYQNVIKVASFTFDPGQTAVSRR